MSRVDLALSVVAHVIDYLSGGISVLDLRLWAATASTQHAESGDPRGWRLLNRVEHRLAEFTNGDWTEDELKQWLRPIATRYTAKLSPARPAKKADVRSQLSWKPRTRSLAGSA